MMVLKRKASASQGWSGEGEFAMQKSLSSCNVLNVSPTFRTDPSECASCSMSGGGNCQSDAQTHAVHPGPFCPVGQPSNSPPLYNVSYSFPPADDSSLNPPAKRLRYLTGCVAANTSNEECGGACQLEGLKESVFLSFNHSVSKPIQMPAFSSLSHSLQPSSYSLDGSAQTSSLSQNRNRQTSLFIESQLQTARSDSNHPPSAVSSMYQESSDAASGRPNGNSSAVTVDSSYDVEMSSSLPGGTNTALTGAGQRALGSAMPPESIKAEGEYEDRREQRRRLWTSENISIGSILFGKTLSRRRTQQVF